mgnify:CR=1 FL=1
MAQIENSAELARALWGIFATLVATIASMASYWLRKKVKELLNDNIAIKEKNETIEKQKKDVEQQKKDVEQQKKDIEQKLPIEHTYTVVVDGPISAGKTCLVQKLVNPCATNVQMGAGATRDPVPVSSKTSAFWESDSWPVIWQSQSDRRAIYCVKACDIGGEKIELIPGKIREIIAERGIVIFVIDANKVDDLVHMERFTPAYAQMGYLPDDVLRRLKGVIFFVNKFDLIPSVGNTRAEFRRKVEQRLFDMAEKFKSKGLRTSYVYGSVATEENLFRLLSEIYQSMGIQDEFPQHPDMHRRRSPSN